jgi:hypothetical protein
MHKKHDTEKKRAIDSGTEPRRTRNRSCTRFAHRTLSIPHAHATQLRMYTCRRRRP